MVGNKETCSAIVGDPLGSKTVPRGWELCPHCEDSYNEEFEVKVGVYQGTPY